jgi:hypothetical protein
MAGTLTRCWHGWRTSLPGRCSMCPGDHRIVVHYNSGEEYTTADYFLTHPDWARDLVLASADRTGSGRGCAGPNSPRSSTPPRVPPG